MPTLWPPDAKSQLIRKDPDAGKDWRQNEQGTTEDEMVGWHHWLDGQEFEQALGVGDGQGGLAWCSPWGHKESDSTERLNDESPYIYPDLHGKVTGFQMLFPGVLLQAQICLRAGLPSPLASVNSRMKGGQARAAPWMTTSERRKGKPCLMDPWGLDLAAWNRKIKEWLRHASSLFLPSIRAVIWGWWDMDSICNLELQPCIWLPS